MNKADLLLPAFRQLAATKATARGGAAHASSAKNQPDKADHFREQLRVIAQAAKPAVKAGSAIGKVDVGKIDVAAPDIEEAASGPELADEDEGTSRSRSRAGKSGERVAPHAALDAVASPQEWRGPDTGLSAMISRLDQAQTSFSADGDVATPVAHPAIRPEPPEASLKPGDATESTSKPARSEPRVTLAVDSAETRTMPPIKVAVRDLETHFEPVQQVTLLQKIVDRMAADLPAATPQAASPAAAPTPELHKLADSPIRSLTLQLDPPDLGAVTVKMRLSGNAVEIRLSADSYETTQMLKHQRGALTEIMQSAGYKFDVASIDQSRAGDANTGAGQQQPQPDQRLSQQPNGGSQLNFADSGRQSNDAQAGTRHNRQQHEQITEPADHPQDKGVVRDRNGGGAVYL